MKLQCNNCKKEVTVLLTLKPFKVSEKLLKSPGYQHNPDWTFHVKAVCPDCKKYIRFLAKTDELVEDLFNEIQPVNSEGII